MAHDFAPGDWGLDGTLQEAFISLPDSCGDETMYSCQAKLLHQLDDATALSHPRGTPPPALPPPYASPTQVSQLSSEVSLSLCELLPVPDAEIHHQTLPDQPPLGSQDVFQGSPQPPWSQNILQGSQDILQVLPQRSQVLPQGSQALPHGSQSPWSVNQLSGALQVFQMPPGFQHDAPGETPLAPLPQDALQEVPIVPQGAVGAAVPASSSPSRRGGGGRVRRASQNNGSRRVKLYERLERFDDPAEEKKRIDAINSKKNRDKKAANLVCLRLKVDTFTQQRDHLLQEIQTLRHRETQLLQQLKAQSGSLYLTSSPPPPLPPLSLPATTTPPPPPPPYHAHHITLTPPPTPQRSLSLSPTTF